MKYPTDGLGAPSVLPEYEVARRYGITPSTWRRMMAKGETPKPIQLSPRRRGYLVEELDAWWTVRTAQRSAA